MNSNLQREYDRLLVKSKELAVLQSTEAIVSWDMETKMPPKALNLRSQQIALLEVMVHKMLTDPMAGKALEGIEKDPGYYELDRAQKRNVYLARKAYDEATKLPEELVFETAKQQTIAVGIWKKAKAASWMSRTRKRHTTPSSTPSSLR
jgi:carboxypeptidase Taq